jgi:hypothetical protein
MMVNGTNYKEYIEGSFRFNYHSEQDGGTVSERRRGGIGGEINRRGEKEEEKRGRRVSL